MPVYGTEEWEDDHGTLVSILDLVGNFGELPQKRPVVRALYRICVPE